MDLIDIQILNFLQEDAKLGVKEIADKLSLTATPVYERIKKLEKAGYIKKYVALLNSDLLGKTLSIFINITIKDHQLKSRNAFIKSMIALKDVTELYHTSGTYDFIARVRFNNISEYRNFLVNQVSDIENIADIDSQIVLEEITNSTKVVLD